ncbi:hypothetical protein HKBW3C_02988 [Candidatus Hakubella thermalkaliphila]|nr:hypothetical protein [Bacillota bacterium]GFP43858.1 hypothetical protein HKBW3C_02988 [Candidatus Hakubella thermalkaliphila]
MKKMNKEKILSYIYLHSILPQLEEIVEFDETAKDIIRNWNASFQFDVNNGPKVVLIFKEGKLGVKREKISFPTVSFWFPNFRSLNKMMEGKSVVPPWWGFWHIPLLKKFDNLTKKIESYLRPTDEFLKNEENLKFNLKIALYSLLWGIKAVAENDASFKVKRAMATISRFQNYTFQLEILPDGPYGYISVSDGKLLPSKGRYQSPTAILQVKDVEVAKKMFKQELDFMIALGTGDLRIIGLISFVEAISIVMEKLSEYLPK